MMIDVSTEMSNLSLREHIVQLYHMLSSADRQVTAEGRRQATRSWQPSLLGGGSHAEGESRTGKRPVCPAYYSSDQGDPFI